MIKLLDWCVLELISLSLFISSLISPAVHLPNDSEFPQLLCHGPYIFSPSQSLYRIIIKTVHIKKNAQKKFRKKKKLWQISK